MEPSSTNTPTISLPPVFKINKQLKEQDKNKYIEEAKSFIRIYKFQSLEFLNDENPQDLKDLKRVFDCTEAYFKQLDSLKNGSVTENSCLIQQRTNQCIEMFQKEIEEIFSIRENVLK
ncbi:MAG: hypothetical protein H0T62_06585 [Parachlamydiaceae bacterium]|nr:hypothetical protein [Parachlamydiaceae bacterium]